MFGVYCVASVTNKYEKPCVSIEVDSHYFSSIAALMFSRVLEKLVQSTLWTWGRLGIWSFPNTPKIACVKKRIR